jgi:PAS domain S-box-containing protein
MKQIQPLDIIVNKHSPEMKAFLGNYPDITETISDFIFIHNLDGKILECNFNYIASELEFTANPLINANLRDLIPEPYKSGYDAYLRRILQTGKDEGVVRVKVPTGGTYIMEYRNSLLFENNLPAGVRGSVRDITERASAEKKLKKNEMRYRAILENIEDFYFEVDLKGRLVFFNDAVSKVSGYTQNELKELHYSSYLSPEVARRVEKVFLDAAAADVPVRGIELEIKLKDGTTRLVHTSVETIKTRQGKLIGFRGVSRDVTRLRQMEAELRQAEADLEKLMAERTREFDELNKQLDEKSRFLDESTIALKVLLRRRDEDQAELEECILVNVQEMVMPYIEKLSRASLSPREKLMVDIIKKNLSDVISPLMRGIPALLPNMTPTESRIIKLIQNDLGTKQIADILHISSSTVNFHRENIRKKLGLTHKNLTIKSYLLSLHENMRS